jgi:hypothetical protein
VEEAIAGMGVVEIRRLKQLEEGEHEAEAAGSGSQSRQDDASGCPTAKVFEARCSP